MTDDERVVKIETRPCNIEITGSDASPDTAFDLWLRVMSQLKERLEAGSFGFGGSDTGVGDVDEVQDRTRTTDRPDVRHREHGCTRRACQSGQDPCLGHAP